MKRFKTYSIVFLLLVFSLKVSAQKKFQVSGYISDMQIASFKTIDSISSTNLIHNRINLKWYPTKHLSFHAGMRNRIYFGNQVNGLFSLENNINKYNKKSLFDFSKTWVDNYSILFNTTIDRLYADWSKKKWSIRVGRQRVNWGKTLVWNPNDWFNTFNYTDFDYPERPGTDALRVRYFPTGMSVLDLVISPGIHKDQSVAALRYGFNKWDYDFQVLGGLYYDDAALGIGWSGNIKSIGIRGEASWFQPYRHLTDSAGDISATVSFDYRTANTWHFQVAALYNSIEKPSKDPNQLIQKFVGSLSPKQLMPTEWSLFGQVSKDITPLWHVDLSAMTGIDPMLLFLMPNMSYSLTENFDISLYGQLFFGRDDNKTQNLGNGIFLRFKYNF